MVGDCSDARTACPSQTRVGGPDVEPFSTHRDLALKHNHVGCSVVPDCNSKRSPQIDDVCCVRVDDKIYRRFRNSRRNNSSEQDDPHRINDFDLRRSFNCEARAADKIQSNQSSVEPKLA